MLIELDEDEESSSSQALILKVRKPEFERCPIIPTSIEKWVEDGWQWFYMRAIWCQLPNISSYLKTLIIKNNTYIEIIRSVLYDIKIYKGYVFKQTDKWITVYVSFMALIIFFSYISFGYEIKGF